MEFRVYAAFGYVTKVVSNGRVNAKLHATPRNWLRLCRAVLYRAVSQIFNLLRIQIRNDRRLQIGNTAQRGKAATNCEKWQGFRVYAAICSQPW